MNQTIFQILLSLIRGAKSATEILDGVREFDADARTPSLASFYRNLKRAADQAWLEVAGEAVRGGPGRPRQEYRITPPGISAAKEEGERLSRLAALVRADYALADPNPKS